MNCLTEVGTDEYEKEKTKQDEKEKTKVSLRRSTNHRGSKKSRTGNVYLDAIAAIEGEIEEAPSLGENFALPSFRYLIHNIIYCCLSYIILLLYTFNKMSSEYMETHSGDEGLAELAVMEPSTRKRKRSN